MGGDSPESAFPAKQAPPAADATSNTGNTTIVDTAASITVVVAAAATATLGGSNLAWRSDLNDRPGFQRAALVYTRDS